MRRNQLCKWAKRVDRVGPDLAFRSPGRPGADDEDELTRLRRENQRLRHPKKGRGVLLAPIALRYAFIREHAEIYSVGLMCRLLGVSRSGYCAGRDRPMSPRDSADIILIARLHEIDREHRRAAGVIKMWHVLRAEKNRCGRNRVARLRRYAGIRRLRTQRLQSRPVRSPDSKFDVVRK